MPTTRIRLDALDGEITHACRQSDLGDFNADHTPVRALCGAQAIIGPDGYVSPADFDFIVLPDQCDLVDCWPCLVQLAKEYQEANAKAGV